MSSRVLVVALVALSACGPAELGGAEPKPDPFAAPEFVPVADCLTSPSLQGSTEAQVQACAGEPCAQAVEHIDSQITLSWALYCAEQRCAQDCYWQVRVYFENGKVSYTRMRQP